eukprot:4268012-Prymnesium_polylepis.1
MKSRSGLQDTQQPRRARTADAARLLCSPEKGRGIHRRSHWRADPWQSGNRHFTFLVYLNDVDGEGGETAVRPLPPWDVRRQ